MPAGIRQTGMTPLPLLPGARIVLEARSPTDGSQVSGVAITDVVISLGDAAGADGGALAPLEPVWLQTENT
jgi:hypothetical protein